MEAVHSRTIFWERAGGGALSPLDPRYKEKLRYALKKKGFSYGIIDKAMELAGVDNQIAQAKEAQDRQKVQQCKAAFIRALQAGDYATAGAELANLANKDKTQAAMLASYFPSFKDSWAQGNKEKDAYRSFQYNQAAQAQQQQWKQANMKLQADLQIAANAKTMQNKIQLEQAAKLQWAETMSKLGVPNEAIMASLMGMGGSRSASGGGSSSSKNNTGAYVDADGIQHYDKETEKEIKELADKISGLAYDVNQITGPDDPLRASTGDAHAEALRTLNILRSRISPEDFDGLMGKLYAINQTRDQKSGFNAK